MSRGRRARCRDTLSGTNWPPYTPYRPLASGRGVEEVNSGGCSAASGGGSSSTARGGGGRDRRSRAPGSGGDSSAGAPERSMALGGGELGKVVRWTPPHRDFCRDLFLTKKRHVFPSARAVAHVATAACASSLFLSASDGDRATGPARARAAGLAQQRVPVRRRPPVAVAAAAARRATATQPATDRQCVAGAWSDGASPSGRRAPRHRARRPTASPSVAGRMHGLQKFIDQVEKAQMKTDLPPSASLAPIPSRRPHPPQCAWA